MYRVTSFKNIAQKVILFEDIHY
uniref:Uncharacterized protein n=1 Tax=Rhizophora mucronata TaxID=61149 RepID=A0A2P2IJ93_RHIMU